MIVAERKPFDEIYRKIRPYPSVLVLGCGTCTTVCMSGGEKEVGVLAAQLRLAARNHGHELDVRELTITRQCDREFFDPAAAQIRSVKAVISLGCGVGAQYASELFPGVPVFPGLNTQFFGVAEEQGVWAERCAGCGDCIIDRFAGICPVARCSKSIFNGPCGGSEKGKCEVDPEHTPCAWQMIYERMKEAGRLKELEEFIPMRDWRSARHGGPRKRVRRDVLK